MEKIKQIINNSLESDTGKDILIISIIILVGLGSFGLGRLSKQDPKESLKIKYRGEDIANEANTSNLLKSPQTSQSGAFFASSKGSKYYSLGCSAGNTIKTENKVYFDTREEAEAGGYTFSTSCR